MTTLRLVMSLLLAACSGPPANTAALTPQVRVSLEDRRVSAGEPVLVRVEIREPAGVDIDLDAPSAEGLTVELREENEEDEGAGRVVSREYALTGAAGSYVVTTGEATVHGADGDTTLPTSPLFVDIGVDGPSSDLQDIFTPPPPPPARWPWVLGGITTLLGLIAVVTWLLRRPKKALPPKPREPADVVARRQWEAVFGDPDLDDHGRALRLSEVFRAYLEAVYGWPATALTTGEIRQRLYDGGLSAALLDRARRMLMPMDLLKYARQGGGADLFRRLDDDFNVFLAETRPAAGAADLAHGVQEGGRHA